MKCLAIFFSFLFFTSTLPAQERNTPDTIRLKDGSYFVTHMSVAKQVKKLELWNMKGQKMVIDSTLARPCVINIWATWCPPCIGEIPTMNYLQAHYNHYPVDFYAVSFLADSVATKRYLDKHSFSFTQLMADRDYVEAQEYSSGYPTTLFLDRKGKVIHYILGGEEDEGEQGPTIVEFKKGMQLLGFEY